MSEGRKVVVTTHAIDRARQRRWQDAWGVEIRNRIVDEVKAAINNGRMQDHKPKQWRLYREKPRTLTGGERFVWTEDDQLGWIVKLQQHEIIVVTTLHRCAPVGGLR
jgi:hypothetical protein